MYLSWNPYLKVLYMSWNFYKKNLNVLLLNLTCMKHFEICILKLITLISRRGPRMIGISGSLIWSKTLIELIFNTYGEFQWSPEGPLSQIHSPHLHDGSPGIFSDLLGSVQMLKGEWGAESNGKLPHLFIPSKTATMVPAFALEDLPLDRTPAFVPEFAVKDLPLGRTHW